MSFEFAYQNKTYRFTEMGTTEVKQGDEWVIDYECYHCAMYPAVAGIQQLLKERIQANGNS